MRRAVAAVLGVMLLLPAGAAAQDDVSTEEWCKQFYSLTRTYWLDEEFSSEAVSVAYDAVTEEDIVGCQSALNMLEVQGVRAASGLEELGFASPTKATDTAQDESYTIDDLRQRCADSDIPGIDDAPGVCLTVLALMLFPDAELVIPDLSGSSNAGDPRVTRSGSGDAQTAPFQLSGGDYAVTAKGSDAGGEYSAGCVLFSRLRSTDDRVREKGGDLEIGPGGTVNDITYVYGIPAGRYYFDLNTSCDSWTVALEPL